MPAAMRPTTQYPVPASTPTPTSTPAPTHTPQPDPNLVRADDNIINRRADKKASLFHIVLNLEQRLRRLPGFEEHLGELEQEQQADGAETDPVTAMWHFLRRGTPLLTIYNALKPVTPLSIDLDRVPPSKQAKMATYQFMSVCGGELAIPGDEIFIISDLFGEDTAGFVKVSVTQEDIQRKYCRKALLCRNPLAVLGHWSV